MKHFLRTSEVALLLGCSPQWVGRLIRAGELDAHRLGEKGWLRVSRNSLDAWARKHGIELDWQLVDDRRNGSN